MRRGGAAEAEGGRPRRHPARDRCHQLPDTGTYYCALCAMRHLVGKSSSTGIAPRSAAAKHGMWVAGLLGAIRGRHWGDPERGARADRLQDRGVAGGGQSRDSAGRALH